MHEEDFGLELHCADLGYVGMKNAAHQWVSNWKLVKQVGFESRNFQDFPEYSKGNILEDSRMLDNVVKLSRRFDKNQEFTNVAECSRTL